MTKEKLSAEYHSKLKFLLEKEGFCDEQINVMLGDYIEYEEGSLYSEVCPQHSNLIDYRRIIKTIVEAAHNGTFKEEIEKIEKLKHLEHIEDFYKLLKSSNVTWNDVLALHSYTNYSDDILHLQNARESENNTPLYISEELSYFSSLSQLQEEKFIKFIKNLVSQNDYENLKEKVVAFSNQIDTSFPVVYNHVKNIIKTKTKLDKISLTIKKTLKNQIAKNTVLHRGVKQSFLRKILKDESDINALVGKKIEEKGFTSTSLFYNMSFSGRYKYGFPIYMKIYVPKGSEGMDITPYSKYQNEYEFLCNANDLYIFDVEKDYIDERGNKRIMLKCFLLSKDRECYKDIAKETTKQNENE